MKRLSSIVVIVALVLSLGGCTVARIALIGAAVGGLAISSWAVAKHDETVQMAAAQNQRVEQVSPDGTERVVAEPVEYLEVREEAVVVEEKVMVMEAGRARVETRSQKLEPGKKYRKVQAAILKKDPETQKEIMVADTTQFIPIG